MMRLTPGSKKALLEQTLKWKPPDKDHSKGFPKTVLINRSFINVARYYNIYRFGVLINEQGAVSVYFDDHKGTATRRISMCCFHVHSLFQLLNPKFFSGKTYNETGVYFIHWLMENSDCHISLNLYWGYSLDHSIPINLLSRIWSRIAEIELSVNDLQTITNALPPRRFNKLTFCEVEGVDNLKACFRQNTEKLGVYSIDGSEFREDIGQAGIEVNETVKCLEICCFPDRIQVMLPTMRGIFSIFPNLLDVEVSVYIEDEHDSAPIEEAADEFKHLDELTALVEGSQIKSAKIKGDQFLKLDDGSTDELIACLKEEDGPVFNKARVKRNQEGCGHMGASIRFKETTGRVKSDFKIFVCHDSYDSDY